MKVDRKALLHRAEKALERIENGLAAERTAWDAWKVRQERADADLAGIVVANGEMQHAHRVYRGYAERVDGYEYVNVQFRVRVSSMPEVEPAPESKYSNYETHRVKQLISLLKLTNEEKVTVTAKMLDAIVLLEDADGSDD